MSVQGQFSRYKQYSLMEALTIRNFRSNLAGSFNRAASGEEVFIRRNNELYLLMKVGDEDVVLAPSMQARVEEARESYKSGKSTSCRNDEELQEFLDSL